MSHKETNLNRGPTTRSLRGQKRPSWVFLSSKLDWWVVWETISANSTAQKGYQVMSSSLALPRGCKEICGSGGGGK